MFERAVRLRRRMTSMKTFSALFLLAVLFSGCTAAFRAASAVALGRQELFQGQNADALESFEEAARVYPDYSFGVDRPEGVLSYLGRSQYLNGQYPQARQTLERDLARDEGNSLSRLYLGLTLVRLNDRQNGLHAMIWGLSGIPYYINYVVDRTIRYATQSLLLSKWPNARISIGTRSYHSARESRWPGSRSRILPECRLR